MSSPEPLRHNQLYHIYNRGINGEPLFLEERNYRYFLKLWARYIEPIAETYAYCLLSNHFHFLVRIKEEQTGPIANQRFDETGPVLKVGPVLNPSRQFNNLFIAYAKAFNKAYQRTGGLFESPFKRRLVQDDRYFAALVAYIHRNPQKHGFVDDFRDWAYSSYHAVLSAQATRLKRAAVLGWFDGPAGFKEAHDMFTGEAIIEPLIAEDWV
jgi:REP element-mobilizing transposase RayT